MSPAGDSSADDSFSDERSPRAAHLVLWGGIAALFALGCFADLEGNTGTRFGVFLQRGAFASPSVAALLNLFGLAVVVGCFVLLPRDHRAPTPSLLRAIAYVVSAFALFALLSAYYGRSGLHIPSTLPFALLMLAWLEARGRNRLWFLAATVWVIVDFFFGWLPYQFPGLVIHDFAPSVLPAVALVGVAWLACLTGFREPRLPAPAPAPGPIPFYGAPTWPGGAPAQNTLAVVGFVLSFFFAIPGVICGHIALAQIRRTGERGQGLAIAALVIGYVGLAVFAAFVLLLFAPVLV